MLLEDKVVVITGASRGLGKQLALKLSSGGAIVALVARTQKDLQDVKKEIDKKGGKSEYFTCDISNAESIEQTFKDIVKKFGRIDILVNNAGIWFQGPTVEHKADKIKELFNTNIVGMINCAKAVIPVMRKQQKGQILNVMSDAGLHPSGEWGIYTSTKYAGRGFTDSLKEELKGTGIKVMGFYPGGMDTNLFIDAGFNKKSEPWMMDTKDVVEVLFFMLTRPEDIIVENLTLRKF